VKRRPRQFALELPPARRLTPRELVQERLRDFAVHQAARDAKRAAATEKRLAARAARPEQLTLGGVA
jgi:hypothetical protein